MKQFFLLFCALSLISRGQTICTFETFTLAPNSFYQSTLSTNFNSNNLEFSYDWDNTNSFWSGGFSYTNKRDSSNGTFSNLYGCRPFSGVSNSNIYATAQDKSVIKILTPNTTLNGMFITNTTYAFKTIKNGNQFAKKFGGVSGNDPDYFKITAKGYKNGAMKNDSAVFYLADYRNSNNALDYVVENWQWFNTENLGVIDSVKFFMYSSDVGQFGINTPLFFSVDDIAATQSFVGLNENTRSLKFDVYPNPFATSFKLKTNNENLLDLKLYSVDGKLIHETKFLSETQINTEFFSAGCYFLTISGNGVFKSQKIIKQ